MKSTEKRMSEAETARYGKINNLISILKGERDRDIFSGLFENAFKTPIKAGGKITIDGDELIIGNRKYGVRDLQKITINKEGSMKLYERGGKKLCGSLSLNLAAENVELLCYWLRLHKVETEIRSGKGEKAFQWTIAAIAVITIILLQVINK